MQPSAHQKEFISANSSGTLLADSTVCHLKRAAALLADEIKATEMHLSPAAISSSSHDLFFSLAVPQSLTPQERTVLAQPSLMFQNPGALPNSIFSGSFHFLLLIQPSGKEVRRMTPHLWSQRPWRGHISQVHVNLFMDWQWKEDPWGPLVLTGSMCSCWWNQLFLAPNPG